MQLMITSKNELQKTKTMTSKKIVVGMSGGVDSSMTVVLLKEQGWDVTGVALRFPAWEGEETPARENACCTDDSLELAKEVCDSLGIPFHIVDAQESFEKEVMGYFVDELKNNRTPNPCIRCNRYMKFANLFSWARTHGIDYVATGHYARIVKNDKTGLYEVHKAKDQTKDQTYGLCLFPQEWIAHIRLPLGNLTKDDVYRKVKHKGFVVYLKKKQSQDLCFVSKKQVPNYIKENLGEKPGDIIDEEGTVLGVHKGLHFYTRGQKKGLRLEKTYRVKDIDPEKNSVIVTTDAKQLYSKDCLVKDINLFSGKKIRHPLRVQAKVRYGPTLAAATVYPQDEEGFTQVVFEEPQFAITPGQFCVLYDGEVCLGGGTIWRH